MTDMADFRAQYGRPRGFVPWAPRPDTTVVVADVRAVLDEYGAYLPLSLRQIFYRLVATRGFPKTERDYKRLGEILNRARRARMIPMDAIRDDGFVRTEPAGWTSAEACLAACRRTAERFTLDRRSRQEERLVVWCEAGGMVPQLERICEPYSIPVYSSGGFDSVTARYNTAREFAGESVHVLHIGDHDPSGVHVFNSLAEDINAFLGEHGDRAGFSRLAVLPEHVRQYGLTTAPPKTTDRRNFHGETVQAEALPPDVLAQILEDAVLEHIDMDVHRAVLEEENERRQWLIQQIGENHA